MSEDDSRKAQMEARILSMENEIIQLKRDLNLGQKALDEGVDFSEAIHLKHQRDVTFITFNWKLIILRIALSFI